LHIRHTFPCGNREEENRVSEEKKKGKEPSNTSNDTYLSTVASERGKTKSKRKKQKQ